MAEKIGVRSTIAMQGCVDDKLMCHTQISSPVRCWKYTSVRRTEALAPSGAGALEYNHGCLTSER